MRRESRRPDAIVPEERMTASTTEDVAFLSKDLFVIDRRFPTITLKVDFRPVAT
jgi:hypothetical protein